ncbi:hypothetical protein [Kitasatospora kifunensis]|uniref:Pyruvate/2-oxoglutarate dehydrogenase complex dihydrolipoamide acyltransferase (E2) component n=1 Tax=Kitasatospora kifunensis TaxID=58351 RepID=A0A7W7VWV1_KITKI|nr:hypothetical protein [Kitasatospora kifunensis]MBB4925816.1 pyruvate/2-oxoglutarate dehydrogenase complex dihydrolipoamide acyltransferase (E2) component [Kitasatospora kifunensis]
MTRHQRALLAVCLAGAAAVAATTSALAAGSTDATASPSPAPTATAQPTQATTTPPPAVEDFAYPGADRILRDQGITLKQGDGHIVLADCATTPDADIQVMSRTSTGGQFCFRVTGASGYLTLEMKDVFALKTQSHPIRATLTPSGQTQTQVVDVAKNQFTPVGEGVSTGTAPTVLVELRATG